MVVDDWQGRGVATELLERLADRARDGGRARSSRRRSSPRTGDALDLMQLAWARTRSVRRARRLVDIEIELPPSAGSGSDSGEALRQAAAACSAGATHRTRHAPLRRRRAGRLGTSAIRSSWERRFADERVGVARPDRARVERGELPDTRPRLLGVLVERAVRNARRALPAGLRIERVERVAHERKPVGFPPEPDHAGRVPGEVDRP